MKKILVVLLALLVALFFVACLPEGDIIGTIEFDTSVIDDSIGAFYSDMEKDGSNIYIVYADDYDNELNFAKSVDNGDNWDINIIESGNGYNYVSMKIDSSNIYIIYTEYNVGLKLAKSIDYGETWNISTISSITRAYQNNKLNLIYYGSTLYISYIDASDDTLKLMKSSNGGTSWDTNNIFNNNNKIMINNLKMDNDVLYTIIYDDSTDGSLDLAKSTNEGNTWDYSNIDNYNSLNQIHGYIVEGSDIFVFYNTDSNYLSKSTDGGNSWEKIEVPEYITYGYLEKEGAVLYLFYSTDSYHNGEMYIAKSVDNGENWKSYLVKGGVSANDLIVEGNNIYISYQDSYGSRVPEFWGRTTFGKTIDN